MTVETLDQAGIKVVRVTGNLDGMDIEPFVSMVSGLVDARGVRVVVDLAGVPFINSRGLSELVTLTAQANARESRIVLAGPSPFVAGVFETTRLDRFFDVFPNVEKAVAAIA